MLLWVFTPVKIILEVCPKTLQMSWLNNNFKKMAAMAFWLIGHLSLSVSLNILTPVSLLD